MAMILRRRRAMRRRRGRWPGGEGGGGGAELEADQPEVSGEEQPVGGEAGEQVRQLQRGGGDPGVQGGGGRLPEGWMWRRLGWMSKWRPEGWRRQVPWAGSPTPLPRVTGLQVPWAGSHPPLTGLQVFQGSIRVQSSPRGGRRGADPEEQGGGGRLPKGWMRRRLGLMAKWMDNLPEGWKTSSGR